MAKFSNVNSIPATGPAAWYLWVTTLVAAGWTHQGGGDGTSFQNQGQTAGPFTVITTGAAGAGGLGNNNAWVRLRSPSGNREFVLQRGTTNLLWRMFYSKGAGFIASASATVRPTATDEAECIGDGVGGFSSQMVADGTYRMHVVAESTATAGGIFGWWMHTTVTGSGAFARFFAYEGIRNTQTGNADKAVFVFAGASAPTKIVLRNTSVVRGWQRAGLADEAWVTQHALSYTNGNGGELFPGEAGANPYTGGDDRCAIPFSRYAGLGRSGYDGMSTRLFWRGPNRVYPDTVDLATDAYVYVAGGDVLMPWPNGVTPLT